MVLPTPPFWFSTEIIIRYSWYGLLRFSVKPYFCKLTITIQLQCMHKREQGQY
ncbi:hypothetical protein UUU_27140 [Klebsiella pneumoniae subsp. pneumoniae DSM 30104 = JCM 1662 = NBRC 14940]|nr:hypothetical protein UUU_27140 [Klebsiella pneumoniae subsp. pneumoniae DSM 30104 = JCM 1662 = NBRC 14940]